MSKNNYSNFPPVIVVGSGGHARVMIDCLSLIGREILFCTEIETKFFGNTVDGILVKGPDELVLDFNCDKVQLVNGLGSVGAPTGKIEIYDRFANEGFEFTRVIHPSAIVAKSTEIEDGVQIMAQATIQPGTSIGSNTIINTAASIDHGCQIGAHCHIAPRVALSGEVVVGKNTHIGTGASVIQGIHIGEGCIVGAGATVVSNLADGTIAIGTPAKPISSN